MKKNILKSEGVQAVIASLICDKIVVSNFILRRSYHEKIKSLRISVHHGAFCGGLGAGRYPGPFAVFYRHVQSELSGRGDAHFCQYAAVVHLAAHFRLLFRQDIQTVVHSARPADLRYLHYTARLHG